MKRLEITLLLLIPLSSFGREHITYIPQSTYKIATEENLKIKSFKLGLKCKIYSKLRLIGAPLSTKTVKTTTKAILDHEIKFPSNTNLYLNSPITLTFPLNEITSYVHACSFIADIEAEKNEQNFERKNITLSDYTLKSYNHDASYDFKSVLEYRTLKINKYTNDIVFQ